MKALLLLSTPFAAVLSMVFGLVVILGPGGGPAAASEGSCIPLLADDSLQVSLDEEQLTVASTIITVGRELQVPPRGWVVALATGMQESGLRPLPYGDRDSLGVFQQRAAWGPVADRMNPQTAATMFFTGGQAGQPGLLDIDGWENLSIAQTAQAVQVSAYPSAYAKWEPLAVRLVDELADIDASCVQPGDVVFPLGASSYVLTAGYGDCGELWSHCHTGQDLAAPTGTPVLAVTSGVVTKAGPAGDYGNLICLEHAGGLATGYAHLSRIYVQTGQHVGAGDVIGLVGATGNTTGPHLHFEVLVNGHLTDPLAWLHQQHLL